MAGIKRKLVAVRNELDAQIADQTRGAGMYGRGLAREGFLGGYLEALEDVALALNGVEPKRWREALEAADRRNPLE